MTLKTLQYTISMRGANYRESPKDAHSHGERSESYHRQIG